MRCSIFKIMVFTMMVVALAALQGSLLWSAPIQITTAPATDEDPSWSPDGSQIAFMSDRSGNYDIWLIPSTGGTAERVTFDTGVDGFPAWSPGGILLAFSSNRSGNFDIWVLCVGGPSATESSTWGRIKSIYR